MNENKRRNWISFGIKFILSLGLVLLLLFALLHSPWIQNRITSFVLSQVVDKSNGNASVERASFDITRGISMHNFLLTGEEKDTLLTLKEVRLSPRGTLISLIGGDLNVNDLFIKGLTLKIKRNAGEELNNWSRFMSGMQGDDQQEGGKTNLPNISHLQIYRVNISYLDEPENRSVEAYLDGLEVEMDELTLGDSGLVHVKRLTLMSPNTKMFIGTGRQASKDTLPESREAVIFPELIVDNVEVINGFLSLKRQVDEDILVQIFDRLELVGREIAFRDLNNWTGHLQDLSGETPFVDLEYLSAEEVSRRNGKTTLRDFTLRTNRSFVRMNAEFDFGASIGWLANWNGRANIQPSLLVLEDLFPFVPELEKEFGKELIARTPIQIGGNYTLSNSLFTGKNMSVWVNGNHHFIGQAEFAPGLNGKEERLNVEVTELKSDITNLPMLYSRIAIPNDLKRLGRIRFAGELQGIVKDYTATGELKSELGNAKLDFRMRLPQKAGAEMQYAGIVELDSFHLGRLTQNSDFGIVNARVDIQNGSGPNLANSNAALEATIETFEYRNFTYRDAQYTGRLSRKVVNGTFIIKDESLDFRFNGLVDFSQEEPIFDFDVDAQFIDFCRLNLVKFPCQLSFYSDVNFTGKNLKSAQGKSHSDDIVIRHDTSVLVIKNLKISSEEIGDQMHFSLESDFIDLNVDGDFHLFKMYQIILQQLLQNHPSHNSVAQFKNEFGELPVQNFVFDLKLKEANQLFEFFGVDIEMKDVVEIYGSFNKEEESFSLDLKAPFLQYDEFIGDSIGVEIESLAKEGQFAIRLEDLKRNNLQVSKVELKTDISASNLEWAASYILDERNKISLRALSNAEENGYFTKILSHDLMIDSAKWNIMPNRGIGIYKDAIDIESLEITDGKRYISLKDINKKGIEVNLKDFNFEFINPLIDYDKLYFTGFADSKLHIDDLFEKISIKGFLEVDDFAINGDDYGNLLVRASQAGSDIIDLELSIEKDTQTLFTAGYLDMEKNFINVDINLENYPMNFFEYIISEGISETTGRTNISGKMYGPLDDMKISALAEVHDAGTKIDYLGTYYRLDNEKIKIDEKFIDLNGVLLIDARENVAVLSGGLRHDVLADFRADLSISSPEFIGLSTTNLDNPLYYGLGNGQLEVEFSGPFDAINMKVNSTTGPLTQLFIPITSTQYGYDESFIKFDYKDTKSDNQTGDDLVQRLRESGVDFEMNLTFNPEAEVSVIYDESTSNILVGRGRGNLRIKVKRDGEFSVYGNYDVESGEYLYTAYGFIAKPFEIKKGGRVTWTGDPINANLEITADYPGLRAPLNVFLQEYIESSNLRAADFSQRREVELTLMLSGTLFDPAIDFDIDFPNLTGELKTLADSKLRTLKSTENGINNQVVGLLFFRNFLPDNNPFASLGGNTLGQSGNNTLTEFLTSQLSLLFTDYLTDKLKDNGLIQGIDFEIAVAQNTSVLEEAGPDLFQGLVDFVPEEVQVNLRNRFKNDNVVLSIGGNYVRQSEFETAFDYLTGDFALDWYISEDKRLKLRFYGSYDYDEAFAERKQKYGFGINYRREFGSISSLQNVLDDIINEVNEQTGPPTTSN